VKRLVVVTEQMISPHGTQMLASLVIDEAVATGWEVVLFTATYDPETSVWTRFLRERNVRVFSPGFWFLTRWYLPHRVLARRMWRFVRRFRPNLVWSPDNEPMTCCALECQPEDAPPLFVHDPGDGSVEDGTYPQLWFTVCKRVAGLSVHGRRQLDNAKKYYVMDRPIEVVWPGSTRPLAPDPVYPDLSTIRFGQFGRLDENKSVATSILAIAALRAQGRAVELHIHGDGPEAGALRALSRQHRLDDCVHFHGEYDWRVVGRLIESIHVGLMTSRREGFGIVILEMISRGRPVIAGDIGSSREVLGDLGGGWVVPCQDLFALTQQMHAICSDPEQIGEAGARGLEIWNRHFAPAKMFERYRAFWRECGADI
jgi:glycosyltransferase involved in cell wall biosynthesis